MIQIRIDAYKRYFFSLICLLNCLFLGNVNAGSNDFDKVLEEVRQDYDVKHISNSQFNQLVANDIVVFDVREKEEYEVSHIQNAIQLDPDMNATKFFSLHADKLAGKTVVFYCSVGVRSSKMLAKLKSDLSKMGINQAYNLEGGAFKWSNDNIKLVRDGQETIEIHPFNRHWGQLIENKDAIKYTVK